METNNDHTIYTARTIAREDAEKLRRKKIVSPEVGAYKYQVKIGNAVHLTNSDEKFAKLKRLKLLFNTDIRRYFQETTR